MQYNERPGWTLMILWLFFHARNHCKTPPGRCSCSSWSIFRLRLQPKRQSRIMFVKESDSRERRHIIMPDLLSHEYGVIIAHTRIFSGFCRTQQQHQQEQEMTFRIVSCNHPAQTTRKNKKQRVVTLVDSPNCSFSLFITKQHVLLVFQHC